MSERTRRRGGLIVQMVGIVVAVLLALGINEWRQDMARAATVDAVLATMHREATTNRAQVERTLGHHRELVTQLGTGGLVTARYDLSRVRLDTTSEARFALSVTDLLRDRARQAGEPPPPPFRQAQRLPDGRWQLTSSQETMVITIRDGTAIVQAPGPVQIRHLFVIDSGWDVAQLTQAAAHMDPEIIAAMAAVRQLHRYVDQTSARISGLMQQDPPEADMMAALNELMGFQTALLGTYDRLLSLLPAPPATPAREEERLPLVAPAP